MYRIRESGHHNQHNYLGVVDMLLTVRSRLYASMGFLIALFWVVALSGVMSINSFNAMVDDVISDDMAVFEMLADFREANLLNRIYWREAILGAEADAHNVKVSFANRTSVSKALEQETQMAGILKRLQDKSTGLDEHDKALVRKIAAGMAQFTATSPPLQAAVQSGSNIADAGRAMAAARDKELIPSVTEYFKHKQEELHEAEKTAESTKTKDQWIIIGVALVASLIALIVSIVMSRSIANPLGASSRLAERMATGDFMSHTACKLNCGYGRAINCDEKSCEIGKVNFSMEQMRRKLADAVSTIQARSSDAHGHSGALAESMRVAVTSSRAQADMVMQVSAATEQLNVSISEVANSVRDVLSSSQNSTGQARTGMSIVKRSQDAMKEILKASKASTVSIDDLQKATHGIQDLTQQIKEITDQTNLLALNAAIEAARAGEAGRGFAVVADEVRKLAENTGATSHSIQQLASGMSQKVTGATVSIQDIEQAALGGSRMAEETAAALEKIVHETEAVQEQIAAISHAAVEQKSAADATAQAMEEIAALTEENDTALDQIDKTAQELRTLADDLMQSVQEFRVSDNAPSRSPATAYA